MNPINDQELETFLIQAELINQKVKALASNQLSPEEFDRQEAIRKQEKRKREQVKKRKQLQAIQKKKLGRPGKGVDKDYCNFCRYCHWEYTEVTPECLRCKKPTMTYQQRREQLESMVDEYKKKKKDREQRKLKWEMWQKTKSMLWKKSSNRYDKWDYFVSDSEEQPQQEPVVPKNDPNFKALEKDIEDRKLNRQKQTQKAKKLKQKGNNQMKQGNYIKAIEYYHLALEHIKDIKSIYTNRALAYLKIGKYDKAIKDCTNVIEYVQVFGKSGQSMDLLFKAFLRRASAYKEKKLYKQAKQDIIKALQIYPKQPSANILKKQIEAFIEHTEKVAKILEQQKQNQQNQSAEAIKQSPLQNLPTEQQAQAAEKDIIKELAEAEIKEQFTKKQEAEKQQIIEKQQPLPSQKKQKNLTPVEEIKELVENINPENVEKLFKMVRNNQKNMTIFIAAKGIKKCLNQLIINTECHKEGFLVACCLRGDGVGEQQVWDFGLEKLHAKIDQILSNPHEMSMGVYFLLEDIFEVLVPMSLHEKYRPMLSGSLNTAKFFETTFSRLITKHKKHPDLLSSFLIYGGNLCSGESKLRDSVINAEIFKILIGTLYDKILLRKTSNRSYLNLKKNVYGFYANLIINENHRKAFCQYFQQIQSDKEVVIYRWDQLIMDLKTYPKSNDNFSDYCQVLLSVFVNCSLGTKISLPSLTECINSRFLSNPQAYNSEIINRCLLILTRLKHSELAQYKKIFKLLNKNLSTFTGYKSSKVMEQLIRLLNVLYAPFESSQDPKKKIVLTEPLPNQLFSLLKGYISTIQQGQIIFCNTCNLFSVIIDSAAIDPAAEVNKNFILTNLKENMKFLIEVAKQKVGNWRKNASILLAKMSLNPQCRQELDKHHGMHVLKSIFEHVKEK